MDSVGSYFLFEVNRDQLAKKSIFLIECSSHPDPVFHVAYTAFVRTIIFQFDKQQE